MNLLKSFSQLIRWKDWGPGKTTILMGLCFYIAGTYFLDFKFFSVTFILFLLFASAQSALGFVLNDWGDQELDKKQGKPNVFINKSKKQKVLSLLLIIGLAILSGFPFLNRPTFPVFWALWVFFAAAYSINPLRFKTRGLSGMIISALSQWSLPVGLTFIVFGKAGGLNMYLWIFALTISGVTLEIAHQRWDRSRDSSTQAPTFATRISSGKIDKIYAYAVLMDQLAVGLAVGLVSWTFLTYKIWWSTVLAISCLLIYLILLILLLPKSWRATGGGPVLDPYYGEGQLITRLLHEILPNFILPILLIAVMTQFSPFYTLWLALFLFWRVVLGKANLDLPFRILHLKKI